MKLIFLSIAFCAATLLAAAQTIPSPKDHFGFNIGDDYQLANYTQTSAYFKKLAASDRVELVDIGQTEEGRPQYMYTSDFYMIGFKKLKAGVIEYGKTKYDNDNGSLYFTKPRQAVAMRDIELEEDGFAIYFHEDYLNGHPLHNEIKKYHYFDYEANEALHLSPREEEIIWDLYHKIEAEYHNNPDEYSRTIMGSTSV